MSSELYDVNFELAVPSATGGAWVDLRIQFKTAESMCPSVKVSVEAPAGGDVTMGQIQDAVRSNAIALLKETIDLLEKRDIADLLQNNTISQFGNDNPTII